MRCNSFWCIGLKKAERKNQSSNYLRWKCIINVYWNCIYVCAREIEKYLITKHWTVQSGNDLGRLFFNVFLLLFANLQINAKISFNTSERWCHIDWLIEQGLTFAQTHYRTYQGQFLQVIWPNQQCQSNEGNQLVFQIRLESYQDHSTMLQ